MTLGRLARALAQASALFNAAAAAHLLARPFMGARSGFLELLDDFTPWIAIGVVPGFVLGVVGRSRAACLAALGAGVGWLAVGGWRMLRRSNRGPSDLTVMTFNVLFTNPAHKRTAAAISEAGPDLVALQELPPDGARTLDDLLGWRYPHRAFVPDHSPKGAGVLSRWPLEDVETFKLSADGHWNQRMLVRTPAGPLTVFNIHTKIPFVSRRRLANTIVPSGFDSSVRGAEVDSLARMIGEVDGPVVVLGDFNMTEFSRDHRRMQRVANDAYRSVGRGFGLTFPRLLSMPRAMPTPFPMLRLDYVWHSRHFKAIHARVGEGGGSDHASIVVGLRRAKGESPATRTC
jgi:vancomycin resistance protein VanJ